MTANPHGFIFVVVGPGGTGKNTLMNVIKQRHASLSQLATATTRRMRPEEKQGREHVFVTHEVFQEMIDRGELLEHQQVTPGKFYGIPRASIENIIYTGKNLIADIEVYGAEILQQTYPDDAVLIFVTVPGDTLETQLQVLHERMLERLPHDPTEVDQKLIQERLDRAKEIELPFKEKCDHIIVNDNFDQAVAELDAIIVNRLNARAKKTPQESPC